MAAENEVKTELSQFWRENNKSRRDTALALFLKICENILQHPLEEKYKKIKVEEWIHLDVFARINHQTADFFLLKNGWSRSCL